MSHSFLYAVQTKRKYSETWRPMFCERYGYIFLLVYFWTISKIYEQGFLHKKMKSEFLAQKVGSLGKLFEKSGGYEIRGLTSCDRWL